MSLLVWSMAVACRDAQPEPVPARPEATPEGHARQADGIEATPEDGQPRGRILHLPAGVPAKVGKVLRYIDEYWREEKQPGRTGPPSRVRRPHLARP